MLITIFLFTILLSFLITLILEKFFSKKNLFIDFPTDNTIHTEPKPSAGGVSILISYLFFIVSVVNYAIADYSVFLILLCSLIPIAIIGLLDDFYHIKIYIRLLVQLFSAAIIVYYFQINNDNSDFMLFRKQSVIIIFIISIILSMWLMNLYNFMDGVDGYAATECIFVSFSASFIAHWNDPTNLLYIYIAGIGAASLGFILRNWYPAKIFMGDTGSVSIGCILSFFIFYSVSKTFIHHTR